MNGKGKSNRRKRKTKVCLAVGRKLKLESGKESNKSECALCTSSRIPDSCRYIYKII